MRKAFSISRFVILASLISIVSCESGEKKYAENPLEGKTILVTAPSNYAYRFANVIEEAGGKAILFPTIQTIINPNTKAIDSIWKQAESIDWLVLPSRKAMDAFFDRIDSTSLNSISKLRFCAIGNDINYLKEKYNTIAAIEPKESGPNGIVEELGKQANIQGQNIVVIAPLVIGVEEPNVIPNFIRDLKSLKANVTKAEGYITQLSDSLSYLNEIVLLKNGKIDIIAFTSTAEIEALIKLTSLELIDKQIVACFGPYTGNNAKEFGLNPEYIGQKYSSFEDFVSGITEYLLNQKKNDY